MRDRDAVLCEIKGNLDRFLHYIEMNLREISREKNAAFEEVRSLLADPGAASEVVRTAMLTAIRDSHAHEQMRRLLRYLRNGRAAFEKIMAEK